MKKLLALILSMLMLCAALPALAEENPDVTCGWWVVNDPGLPMKCFYHFSKDGSWYGYFFDGSVVQAGMYTIGEGIEYAANPGVDGEYNTADDVMATSDYAITCVTYNGSAEFSLPVVGETMPRATLGGMATRPVEHRADYVYVPETEETVAVVVYKYYADNREGASLTLYHNHTYADFASEEGDEGKWASEDMATFALTSDWDGDASLVVDGGNAVYTTIDGDEIALADHIVEEVGTAVCTFKADAIQVGLPMSVDARIECYADGTCKLLVYVAAVSADLEADQGTYTIEDMFRLTLDFEKAGVIAGVPDFASATQTSLNVTVPYAAEVSVDFMGKVTPLTIDAGFDGTIILQ